MIDKDSKPLISNSCQCCVGRLITASCGSFCLASASCPHCVYSPCSQPESAMGSQGHAPSLILAQAVMNAASHGLHPTALSGKGLFAFRRGFFGRVRTLACSFGRVSSAACSVGLPSLVQHLMNGLFSSASDPVDERAPMSNCSDAAPALLRQARPSPCIFGGVSDASFLCRSDLLRGVNADISDSSFGAETRPVFRPTPFPSRPHFPRLPGCRPLPRLPWWPSPPSEVSHSASTGPASPAPLLRPRVPAPVPAM